MLPLVCVLLSGLTPLPAHAQESEVLYLSGTGNDDAVLWDFLSTGGRRSGSWTTIPVPSNWELQGFGAYDYGMEEDKADEQGRYRTRFILPQQWRNRHIEVVFDGVMTDAAVWVNGRSAGPEHRGGFFRFSYDISGLARFDEENLLEVLVSKRSADESVNRAERDADYWVFGGIYRPVYLEASPQAAVTHVAIDAKHDGRVTMAVETRAAPRSAQVVARIVDAGGRVLAPLASEGLDASGRATLVTEAERPQPWSAESPTLYSAIVELVDGGRVLHRVPHRFGFRTVEVRVGEGLFVNGHRVLLKGINRHAFWPTSGRTSSRSLDYEDVSLIKELNANAVRASHYPPDKTFLEACDELGLYVIDELPGWHDAYDTSIGRRRLRQMVRRDVNHPSVILWANGNEGGWNEELDGDFALTDLQRRSVIHPGAVFAGIDASHYPTWTELAGALDGERTLLQRQRLENVVLPTEFLHALYDGGGGAGLADYWSLIRASRRAAGGFLWVLSDEGVVRTDHADCVDTHGNYGADGIVGPFRQKEGSFDAVRRIWSPVHFPAEYLDDSDDGRVMVQNRYDMTDLASCRVRWQWLRFPDSGAQRPAEILAAGETRGPSLPAGAVGEIEVGPPPVGSDPDALHLIVLDPFGREVESRVLPRSRRTSSARRRSKPGPSAATVRSEEGTFVLAAAGMEARFDTKSGELLELRRDGRLFSLGPGPHRASGARPRAATVRSRADGADQVIEVRYESGLQFAIWRLESSGWLRLSYQYWLDRPASYFGIGFAYPEALVQRFVWFGQGPHRVWHNRRAGGDLALWQTIYNQTMTGVDWTYPEFKGYYARVYWGDLETQEGRLTVVLEADDLDLGLYSAGSPPGSDSHNLPLARYTAVSEPSTDISLLNRIPAIGTKFHPAEGLSSAAGWSSPVGLYRGAASFFLHPAVAAQDPGAGGNDEIECSPAKACPPPPLADLGGETPWQHLRPCTW